MDLSVSGECLYFVCFCFYFVLANVLKYPCSQGSVGYGNYLTWLTIVSLLISSGFELCQIDLQIRLWFNPSGERHGSVLHFK